ncbi:CHASE domain-containing protein [Opitutus sp. ER46]|uniref:CHASE domain-containing protein n=1 Tax=Opitutus sp. ER46 TaxID=2161864 RepID=UPI000D3101DE|nr:CHASE domain-containing protein [Opitutus sp. ER46]PTX91179.1 hypothetical protein DB354_21345 [Opitutus sp. ER46]
MSTARFPFLGSRLPRRVLIVGCGLSLLAGTVLHLRARAALTYRADEYAADLGAKIDSRLWAYLALLRGAAGFFSTEGWITPDKFARYFSQVDVARNYPGLQGVGYTLRLAPAEAAGFAARRRAEGRADFRIWPMDPRPEYHTIVYLEPDNVRNRAALGYDMHTDVVRRTAMDRARDTGQPAATGKVTLVQEIDTAKQAGFLIYVPFYLGGGLPATVTARRERLAGYAYSPIRAGDFINALLGPGGTRGGVAVYDGMPTPDNLLYRTGAAADWLRVSRVRTLWMADRPWTLVYTSERGILLAPLAVTLAGFIAAGGVAFLVRGLERARREAHRSEAETREREGELALLVDAVPALVSYIDQNRILRVCNRRYADWFGVSPGALVGRRVGDAVGLEGNQEVETHLRRALAGEGVSFERWQRIPGAGARYLGTIYVPHRGPAGHIVGVYALTSDLTVHKRAEEAARFVADCGQLLISSMDFETTTRGIVHLAVPRVADLAVLFRAEDGKLRATAVAHVDEAIERELHANLDLLALPIGGQHNLAAAARMGVPVVSPQIDRQTIEHAVEGDAQRRLLQLLDLRSAVHVPVVVRGRLWAVFSLGTTAHSGRQFSDEQRQLAEDVSTRLRLAVENALLYREAQQEIEERRRAERTARETEERFRLLVEGVRDYAIMALDREARIDSWNEGAEQTLGFPAGEVMGTPAARFYTAEDQAAGQPERDLAQARQHEAASNERWFVRRDGSRFWGSSHFAVLHESDRVRGYAWILRDLTDRKRMEEELERRVQARTAELHEAVQELEAFSYSVSHDLRAPLRTIRGFTELALEEAGPRLHEEERGYLGRVHRASARLDRLISDLLAYTRVSKTKVELRPVDLHALVSDIRREHPEFQPPRANVEIEGTLLPVVGNEAYLTQCLTNLLGNAVKFVAPGTRPEVRVATESREGVVRLRVSDNGIGIPPERLNKAFEIFERLHTTGDYEGTGVGLAIVRRAVQRMKGRVGVSSEVGRGTTFWIELPPVPPS